MIDCGTPRANEGSNPTKQADRQTISLEELQRVIYSGKVSQYAFLLTTFATILVLLFLVRTWSSFFSLAAGFALIGFTVWVWSSRVDSRLNSAYSHRWNQHRATLRQLLKTDQSALKTSPSDLP